MADHPLLTPNDLDAMRPDQRAAAFDERIVRDLDEFPPEFRTRIVERALPLGDELRSEHNE